VKNARRVRKQGRSDQPRLPTLVEPISNPPIGRGNQMNCGCIWRDFVDIQSESWLWLGGINHSRQNGAITATILNMSKTGIELSRR
jgi:hypothetical protein